MNVVSWNDCCFRGCGAWRLYSYEGNRLLRNNGISIPHYTTSPPRRLKPWYLSDSENKMSYSYNLIFLRKSKTPLKTCRCDGQSCKEMCSEDNPKCNKGDLRPRRTSTSGMWSGLRMTINTFPGHIPPRHEPDQSAGVLVSRRIVIWSHISWIGATRLYLLTSDDAFRKTAGILGIRHNDSLPQTSTSWNVSVERPIGKLKMHLQKFQMPLPVGLLTFRHAFPKTYLLLWLDLLTSKHAFSKLSCALVSGPTDTQNMHLQIIQMPS
jgi:hypothetical protein